MSKIGRLSFGWVVMMLASAMLSTPTLAQPVTPAVESVCDSMDGAAWGLCNAYCEAMDCDSASPNANRTACDKVKGKFALLGVGDLPCEQLPCPCGTGDDFIGLFTHLEPGAPVNCVFENPLYGPSLQVGMDPGWPTVQRFGALHKYPYPDSVRCSAFNPDGSAIVEVNDLTEEEYESCKVEVQSVADQLGIECVPWPW